MSSSNTNVRPDLRPSRLDADALLSGLDLPRTTRRDVIDHLGAHGLLRGCADGLEASVDTQGRLSAHAIGLALVDFNDHVRVSVARRLHEVNATF